MGKPPWGHAQGPNAESIGVGRAPGELKHLSTPRKRNDSLSSGERKGNSPNRASLLVRGCRARQMGDRRQEASRMVWESQPEKVTVL